MSTIFVLIARRFLGNWRLMSALTLGFVIAVALMAATILYADALDDLGLDFALDRAQQEELNIVVSTGTRLNPIESSRLVQQIESQFDASVGRYTRGRLHHLRSGTFYPTAPGPEPDLANDGRPRAHFQARTSLLDHVLVQGRPPNSTATAQTIEAAIGKPAADRLDVSIGDQFDLYPFWDLTRAPLRVTIVGIYQQADPADDYWTGATEIFDHSSTTWDTYAFFADERALVDGLGAAYGDLTGDLTVIGLVDKDRLNASGAKQARFDVLGFEGYLRQNVRSFTYTTTLPTTLQDFQARLNFSRIPLFVLIIQNVGIAVYYLVMVASMLVERQAGEIALLKSRGGTTRQVMTVYLIEGLALSAFALALGPLLAALTVRYLGTTGIFSELTNGEPLRAPLTTWVYAVAAGGALLALLALLLPAYLATRRTIVHYKQSLGRTDQQPSFFRYYFDLFFVALLGILFFQLRHKGSLASKDIFGDLEADPLLILSPAVFLLTAGIVFLRVFPLILRAFSWLLGKTPLTPALVAMWHLVRNPTHYGRLVLLLILATSLGMFAAGFGTTLNANYRDRGRYEAGAGARFIDVRPTVYSADQYYQRLSGADGVQGAAVVLRGDASYRIDSVRSVSADIFGIDQNFQDVAYFRPDFAPDSLAAISQKLDLGKFEWRRGPAIAEGDTAIAVWVYVDPAIGRHEINAQVRDASGVGRDVRLFPELAPGAVRPRQPDAPFNTEPGWVRYSGVLHSDFKGAALTVDGLSLRRPVALGADNGRLVFDELMSYKSPADGAVVYHLLTSFEQPDQWEVLTGQTRLALPDRMGATTTRAHEGNTALELTWTTPLSTFSQRGLRIASPSSPLKLYASDSFLEAARLKVGDSLQLFIGGIYLNATVVGSLTYFPTVQDPVTQPYLVTDLSRLTYIVNRLPGFGGLAPNELWLDTSTGFDEKNVLGLLPNRPNQVMLARAVSAGREEDPLTVAGWQGILAISFGAVLTLSAVGFLVYSYLSAQGRRLEFAILRTLGLTRLQVAGVVATEQTIVVGLGMIAGSLVGIRLGPLMIGYLGIDETGAEVVPPYRDVTDWFTIIATYGVLAAVFLGATLLIIALYSRLAIHRVLRLGEL